MKDFRHSVSYSENAGLEMKQSKFEQDIRDWIRDGAVVLEGNQWNPAVQGHLLQPER